MSLFKRENKEDKERKKLEKKLLKESKHQQQQQQNNNNVNLSNINSNNNNNININTKRVNSLDINTSTTNANEMEDLDNTTTNIANLITKFEVSPNKDKNNGGSLNAPPRPKKGILKGMSKFTHSISSTSSASSTSSPLITKIITHPPNQLPQLHQQQQQNLNIDVNSLNLPDIKKSKDEHQSIREIFLPTSSLDKINIIEKNNPPQYFIESTNQQGVSGNDCLLPGDMLLQVNNLNCKDLTIAQIRQQIVTHSQINKPLQVKVKTSPESLEFVMRNTLDGLKVPDSYLNNGTLKRVGSLRHKAQAPVLRTQISSSGEQQVLVTSTSSISSLNSSNSSNSPTNSGNTHNTSSNDDYVWLVHTNGYSSARIISKINDTVNGTNEMKYKIKLDNGNIVEVLEENIEKANPNKFDRIEDLSNLRFINETSIIHTIRQRYGSSLIHTYAGTNLIVVKPIIPLSIYNDKV